MSDSYIYTRVSLRAGVEVHREAVELSSAALLQSFPYGPFGAAGFHALLGGWNVLSWHRKEGPNTRHIYLAGDHT